MGQISILEPTFFWAIQGGGTWRVILTFSRFQLKNGGRLSRDGGLSMNSTVGMEAYQPFVTRVFQKFLLFQSKNYEKYFYSKMSFKILNGSFVNSYEQFKIFGNLV